MHWHPTFIDNVRQLLHAGPALLRPLRHLENATPDLFRELRHALWLLQANENAFLQNLIIANLYLTSLHKSRRYREFFTDIQSYCMFIGYPRSGHSLIGSLLDAHRNVVIAHEMDALHLYGAGFRRDQVFSLLLENSRRAAKKGRQQTGYSYAVPEQWQGNFQQLRVIGDKKGGRSTMRFRKNPELLKKLQDTLNLELKFIHVIRNPYDVISTMALRNQEPHLDRRVKLFFDLCETIERMKTESKDLQIFDLKYESFLDDPKSGLQGLCDFLGVPVEASDSYLESCSRIVYQSPHKSRLKLGWSREWIDRVGKKIERFDFLSGYSYES